MLQSSQFYDSEKRPGVYHNVLNCATFPNYEGGNPMSSLPHSFILRFLISFFITTLCGVLIYHTQPFAAAQASFNCTNVSPIFQLSVQP